MTTREDIREWLSRAEPKHTHMLVVCDQFDWDDYPVFLTEADDAREKADEYDRKEMSKTMEVYNLKMPIEDQLNSAQVFNF